jgi:hypothetical protein
VSELTPLEMDPAIRARWTAALRSGETPQALQKLRDADARCCLGVLCDLAVADGVIPPPVEHDTDGWLYAGAGSVLPEEVARWAGLKDQTNPYFADELEVGNASDTKGLAELNDDGWSFAQIADAIDGKQPEVTA